jgi:hypothetical protein
MRRGRQSRAPGSSADHSFERLVSLVGRPILFLQRLRDFRNVHASTRRFWERSDRQTSSRVGRLFCEFARSIDAQSNLIGIPDYKTQKKMSVGDATGQDLRVQSCYPPTLSTLFSFFCGNGGDQCIAHRLLSSARRPRGRNEMALVKQIP